MKEIIMVKYGEIALKGINKKTFEDMLQNNIKRRLKKIGQFGYEQIFPMYSLTVLAEFRVLERLDAIITAVWVLCFIAKMSYFLFVNSYLLNELTKIKRKYSPFVCAVPVGIGAMLMSKNIDILADVIKSGFLTVLFIGGGIVIPITVVIIEKIQKNKNKARFN